MRERDIEAALVNGAAAIGALTRKVSWVGRVGAPDRIVVLRGRCVWVELKAPGGRLSKLQAAEHAALREQGQEVVVIDSISGVATLLQELADDSGSQRDHIQDTARAS